MEYNNIAGNMVRKQWIGKVKRNVIKRMCMKNTALVRKRSKMDEKKYEYASFERHEKY